MGADVLTLEDGDNYPLGPLKSVCLEQVPILAQISQGRPLVLFWSYCRSCAPAGRWLLRT